MGLFDKLRSALGRTRDAIGQGVRAVVPGKKLDEDALRALEESLLRADVGAATAAKLVTGLRERFGRGDAPEGMTLLQALAEEVARFLGPAVPLVTEGPEPVVWLISGVNGAGKTTTTAKLGKLLAKGGKRVLLVAGDTFRAAGSDQLEIWGERLGLPVFAGARGADPSSVCFDGVAHAIGKSYQAVVVDTAGRLHTRHNLMEELKKIRRVVEKARGAPPAEVLLVLDGSTGQNALSQATVFHEALGVTGLIVTKLDGSAKGGSVLAVRDALKLPVKAIGVGEKPEDLEPFDPEAFAAALFDAGNLAPDSERAATPQGRP